ncbi:adenylate kinase [Pantoea sp. Aalb]|uniref:adenylate kinase n=1 Tax=Pantoea sp. Aalb TaxID=2576762 RepID=UPI001326804E|nr:adenylate kinase [Pantoea sp. Aalb]MXP67566.1 adenylate kinase [Pantoea sp. Aalb]
MRIILLGAPGTGKGTQAKFITKRYSIPHISTGNMLRLSMNTNNEIGQKVKNIVNSGKLVSDDLILMLIKERLLCEDCKNGFLFDGFPRTIFQAETIKQAGINIDCVLEFYVPKELIIERITGRRVHLQSGRIYHIKYDPPKIENKDNITGEELSIRKDDTKETINKRLIEYSHSTLPLIDYYHKEAIKGHILYQKIDASLQISKINNYIINLFDKYFLKNK